jgi:hypothetical protein
MKKLLIFLGLYYTLLGFYLLFASMHFYEMTPGVSMMGPYNKHFVLDVSFAFLDSGISVQLGAIQPNNRRFMATDARIISYDDMDWRDFIVDRVSVSDFLAVIIPGLLVMLSAIRSNKLESHYDYDASYMHDINSISASATTRRQHGSER